MLTSDEPTRDRADHSPRTAVMHPAKGTPFRCHDGLPWKRTGTTSTTLISGTMTTAISAMTTKTTICASPALIAAGGFSKNPSTVAHCERYLSKEDAPLERKPLWIWVGVIACLYVVYRWIFG